MSETNNPLGPEGSYYEAKAREQAKETESKWNALYPIFITGLYLVLGFLFGLWHPGWLLFLTIPLYYMRPKTLADRWLNPVMIVLIYLVLGLFFNLWHPGWMIFFAIPVAAILHKKGS
ncbi:MAG: efflux RND transporter permease subunit [Clostridiales bacterium]|nr:efflux RND transporter permease subunit [Clostridiales bacterium]